MKRIRLDLLVALLAFVLPIAAHAQLIEGEDDPLPPFDPDELTYVGLGVGYTPMAIFMDLSELNALGSSLQLDKFEGPLLLHSGMLVFTPIFLQGVRVGFFGSIGYHKQSKEITLAGEQYTRTLRFGVRFKAGVEPEYAMPLTRKLTILPGCVIGLGSVALELTQTKTGQVKFRDVINDSLFNAADNNHNRAARMLNTSFFVQPGFAVEYALTGTIMVRLDGGYHYGFSHEWVDEGGTIYTEVPDISADGPFAQVGFFIGLFQQ
jgi:hypothetical protein